MASFSYRARSHNGEPVDGVLDAADSGSAAALLTQRGMVPVRIQPLDGTRTESMPGAGTEWWRELFERRIDTEDLLGFSRQMHTLLRAGVPITRALAALSESNTHRGFGRVLMDLRQDLESGRELSAAMGRHDKVFGPFYRSLVRIGETTGRLDEVFIRLFEHLDFDKAMRQQVKSALRYPVFVVVAMVLAMVVINLFVIPAFAGIYKSFHAELPVLTRILIAGSDFTVRAWPVLLGGATAGILVARQWLRTTAGRLIWDRLVLRIPLAGSIVQKAILARFSRSLALSLKSAVPITEALAVTGQTVDNAHVSQRVDDMRAAVSRGESITSAARSTGVFTPVVLQMIAIGEESGSVDELLHEVALAYERDVAYELKTLADHIEPVLIVTLGIMVLILALGVFLPMWDLGRATLGNH